MPSKLLLVFYINTIAYLSWQVYNIQQEASSIEFKVKTYDQFEANFRAKYPAVLLKVMLPIIEKKYHVE